MNYNTEELVELSKKAAVEAGKAILAIYESEDFGIEQKGDQSPLTKADKAAHETIVSVLQAVGLPILSEEGKDVPFDERSRWEYFWMVDPLDGTKEFIKRNGEFTVNIALIHRKEAIAGVVYTPVGGRLYWGIKGKGAFMQANDRISTLKTSAELRPPVRVVASRSHMSPETEEFIRQFPSTEIVSMGSSLKFMIIAERKADIYPRFGPTMEWDTAAAQAVLESAGGSVIDQESGLAVTYNKENLRNNFFVAKA